MAHPEIAKLPDWVVALVAAGGLAAALSTAAGLLLVISTAISHDLLKKTLMPKISESRSFFARFAAAVAVLVAGLFGINPPGFGRSCCLRFWASCRYFFPVIFLGIFYKKMNKEAAISAMLTGLIFTSSYIVYFKFINPSANTSANWWFGISPEGIGTLGMIFSFRGFSGQSVYGFSSFRNTKTGRRN